MSKNNHTEMDESLFNTTMFKNLTTDQLLNMCGDAFFQQEKEDTSSEISAGACPECKTSEHVIDDYSQGVKVCQNCGIVTGNITDINPEWHNYDDASGVDNTRCSIVTNNLLPSSSVTTRLIGGDSKLRKAHIWIQGSYRDRSLKNVQDKLINYCIKGKITKKIAQEAFSTYRIISDCVHKNGKNAGNKVITRGNNRKSLIAACIFFACKKYGESRSSKEIAKICDLDYTDVNKGCKTFNKLIDLTQHGYQFKISIPEHFVDRFCKALNIKRPFSTQAIKIAKNARKLNLASDHTPLSIATGSILLMIELNGLSITKRELSEKFEVSEVTINKAFEKINQFKKIVINDQLTDVYTQAMTKIKNKVVLEKIPEEKEPFEIPTEMNQTDIILTKKDEQLAKEFKSLLLEKEQLMGNKKSIQPKIMYA